jgi:hypothetical protein
MRNVSRTARSGFGFVVLALAGSIVVGCGAKDTGDDGASASDELAASSALEDHVEVAPDRLVFDGTVAKSADLAAISARVRSNAGARGQATAPVILVGRRQATAVRPDGTVRSDVKNPNGYLRKAVSVQEEDGKLVVVTAPATIIEANQELQRLGMIDVTNGGDDDDTGDGQSDGWQWQRTYPFTLADVDLSRTLYEHDIGAGIGKVVVGLKDSHLKVTGTLDAMAAGKWVSPRAAHAILSLDVEGNLLLDGAFDGAFGASSGKIELYRQSFDIASFGGGHFPLTLDFVVTGECDLAANGKADAQVGGTMHGTLGAGAQYSSNDGMSTVWKPEWPALEPVGPTLTSAARVEGKCGVTATATVHLFDALGPDATVGIALAVDANAQSSSSGTNGTGDAKVTASVDASVGGTLDPFGVNLGEISTDPYHQEWVIFDAPVHF